MKHRGTKQIYTKKENWKTPRAVFDRLTSFVKEEEKTAFFTPKDKCVENCFWGFLILS